MFGNLYPSCRISPQIQSFPCSPFDRGGGVAKRSSRESLSVFDSLFSFSGCVSSVHWVNKCGVYIQWTVKTEQPHYTWNVFRDFIGWIALAAPAVAILELPDWLKKKTKKPIAPLFAVEQPNSLLICLSSAGGGGSMMMLSYLRKKLCTLSRLQ